MSTPILNRQSGNLKSAIGESAIGESAIAGSGIGKRQSKGQGQFRRNLKSAIVDPAPEHCEASN